MIMKIQAPKMLTFIIAVILVVLGLIGKFAPTTAFIGPNAFWFVFVGFVLVALGLFVKGL